MSEEERVQAERGHVLAGDADVAIVRRRPLAAVAAAARRRLGRLELRRAASRRVAVVCGAAAVSAASRPLVWPLDEGAPWKAVLRATLLAAVGASIALGIVLLRAWRGRPSLLASVRRLDEALGLAEVIASGFAFERDGRSDEMASFATDRARSAVEGVALERVLVPERRVRSARERRWLAAALAAMVLGLAVGSVDRLVVERAIHPLTSREAAAAAELKKAAEHAAANAPHGLDDPKSPNAQKLLDAARRASEAAKRGDRRAAQEALDEMRTAARALEAEQREQARSLRSIRDELEGASAAAKGGREAGARAAAPSARRSATASEALARLAEELASSSADKEALRQMLEHLQRAESAARVAGEKLASGKSGGGEVDGKRSKGENARSAAWSRAAAALKEAREAAARGDAEAAKRAMARAERELAALEKASGDPSSVGALAQLADWASELDRAMDAAMRGAPSSKASGSEPGNDGRDGREPGAGGEDTAGARGARSKGNGEPSGAPGDGPGGADRTPGPEQRRLKIDGDLQARTDVREGERAVSVLQGMGRGGDPKAYGEIFPSYDTVVEDGLREDSVPAARRPIVRRYFSSIRPGGEEEESRNGP